VYRSRDGGQRWEKLAVDLAKECAIGTPRVTATVVDPDNPHIVWAGVEIDGVHRSLDGGDTWGRMAGGLADPDIHGMVIARGNPTQVLTSTPREIFASTDVGESWQRMHIAQQFPAPYCRWIAVKPDDPQVIFAACGDSAIGSSGNLQRTTDGGQSWRTLAGGAQLAAIRLRRQRGQSRAAPLLQPLQWLELLAELSRVRGHRMPFEGLQLLPYFHDREADAARSSRQLPVEPCAEGTPHDQLLVARR
jgi:photosystem II stability/assembly factor-like uncharacterized protein